MALFKDTSIQFSNGRHILLAAYCFATTVMMFSAGISFFGKVPMEHLTRDSVAVMAAPIYTGALSNIGLVLWSMSAAVCFLGYLSFDSKQRRHGIAKFFLASGALNVVLLLDDMFLFHEMVFPHFGVPQAVVYLGYFLIVALYLWTMKDAILKSDYILLVLAFAFFGVSIGVDVLVDVLKFNVPGEVAIEDSAKFFGIVTWFAYFVGTTIQAMRTGILHQEVEGQ